VDHTRVRLSNPQPEIKLQIARSAPPDFLWKLVALANFMRLS
jgi:hypothetical protein